MRRYGLRDDQWDRIKDLLPGREGHVGGTAKDNRLFIEAVLYRFRTGCPRRDLPERFGHWKLVHQRFSRWAKSGVFERIFKLLAVERQLAWPAILVVVRHCWPRIMTTNT
jgi:transposase